MSCVASFSRSKTLFLFLLELGFKPSPCPKPFVSSCFCLSRLSVNKSLIVLSAPLILRDLINLNSSSKVKSLLNFLIAANVDSISVACPTASNFPKSPLNFSANNTASFPNLLKDRYINSMKFYLIQIHITP